MKKIMFVLTAIALAVGVQAAQVAWQFTGDSSMTGYKVYVLLGDTATTTWADEAAVSAAALTGGAGTVAKNGRNYMANGTVNDDAVVKGETVNLYYVIVNGDKFATTSPYNASAGVYDINAGDSPINATSQGGTGLTYTSFSGGSGGGGDIPEPTSGLLLLVGGAMLALRRKQK